MPKVFNKRHPDIPRGAVYVGRPTKFGNPFPMRKESERNQCCDQYREWIYQQDDLLEEIRETLRGLDLVCWCAPKRCHADILLKIANDRKWCDVCALDYDLEDYPFGCPQH